eukprot:Skav211384  [mRNA]  locus=scaffold2406:204230:205827:- [translate_table: standard]
MPDGKQQIPQGIVRDARASRDVRAAPGGKHVQRFSLDESETLGWRGWRAENLQSDSSNGSPTRDDGKLRRSSEPLQLDDDLFPSMTPSGMMQGIVKNVERTSDSSKDALASTIPAGGKHVQYFPLHKSRSECAKGSVTMDDDGKPRLNLPWRATSEPAMPAQFFMNVERTPSDDDELFPSMIFDAKPEQDIQTDGWFRGIFKNVLAFAMPADEKPARHFPLRKSETPHGMHKRAENFESDSPNASPTRDEKPRISLPSHFMPRQISDPSPVGRPRPKPNHVMLSGRFLKDRFADSRTASRIRYMKDVKTALEGLGIRTFMVDVEAGQSFGERTMAGLASARVMIAFCTSTYGERTGGGYETYEELKYAYEHRNECHLIALKLSETYPPVPPDPDGQSLCKFVFSPGTVYIDGLTPNSSGHMKFKDSQDIASNILQCLQDLHLFDEVAMKRSI